MFANIWAAVVVIILLIFIVWNMVRLDQSSSKSFIKEDSGEETVVKNYEQMTPMHKINFLSNKLFELKKMNLCPCDIKIKSMRNRLEKLGEIKEKLVLQNFDEQCKCSEAFMWLERPEKKRG